MPKKSRGAAARAGGRKQAAGRPRRRRSARGSGAAPAGATEPFKRPESMEGTVVFRVPFPEALDDLKGMTPVIVKQPYRIDYVHSFGQDSPFFAGLANGHLLGTRCRRCDYTYATPRLACMYCAGETDWVELPKVGRVHTFTTCYFGSEEFLPECPFNLILVEFEGVDTLFLARLLGATPEAIRVGMEVQARFVRHARFKPTDVYFVPRSPSRERRSPAGEV
jgi:uncharacterized OB-fold protein